MNKYWIGAGLLNLLASLMHFFMGYYDPLVPLFETNLNEVSLATILAVWAMATLLMFVSSFMLLFIGRYPKKDESYLIASLWGYLYIAFSFIFVALNFYFSFFALPQCLLLFPVGILALYGRKKC